MSRSGTLTRVLTSTLLAAAVLGVFPLPASAYTRTEVHQRGRVWVDQWVPYSQSRWATVEGVLVPTGTPFPERLGYRTDCSGFVSMCLGFTSAAGNPLSLSTATLDNVMIPIEKEDLQRGDVILRPNDLVIGGTRVPYGHAVLFLKWADAAHTRYIAYHQSSGGKGTVRAEIRWGTSGFGDAKGFAPYRYQGVDDAVRPPATTRP